MSEFIVITGMSGAGRSQAANDFEDLGWFVIDNLPPELIPKVAELAVAPGSTIARVALVVGAGTYRDELVPALTSLRATGSRVRVLYLDASTDALVRRYESTRRRHPLLSPGEGLADAIERERSLLEAVKGDADVVVDTTDLNVHQLRERIVDLFGGEPHDSGMQTTVMSFGYKHGLPLDVDVVLDCRFLPNPHWVDELRPHTGLDEPVRRYVLDQPASAGFLDHVGALLDQPATAGFLEHVGALLELLLPAYVAEGKAYLTIALGCTGGRHRSVAMAEEVGRLLRDQGFAPTVLHRDVGK